MCGRYAIEFEEEVNEFKQIIDEINRRYANTDAFAQMKTGEIFPSDTVPILASGNAQPFLMNWGFPRWDKKGLIINARAETAIEKNLFRPSLLTRRCIVPSTGFYEWSHPKPPKTPTIFDYSYSQDTPEEMSKGKYLLRLPKSPVLYMAGFYNADPSKKILPAFVILTTAANEWISPLHDRMPLILEENERQLWLSDERAAKDILSRPCKTPLSAEIV